MENTQQTQPTQVAVNREVIIKCAIRRKPNLPKGIPGESPLSRSYKLAAGLARGGRGPVKGIEGDLERIIMPQVVNVTSAEPDFFNKVSAYWNDIGVVIPSDEESNTKEKGKVVEVRALLSERGKTMFDKETDIEAQMKIISTAIEKKEGVLNTDYIHDFLILSFALVRSTVANRFVDINKASNIIFYIDDTRSTIKDKLSLIERINKANKLFNVLVTDDIKVKSVLTLLKVDLGELDTSEERIIALHEVYTLPMNIDKFLAYVEDRDLIFKYLVTSAINNRNLREQPNTGNVYYNDILIGKSIDETVMYLKSPEKESREILRTLEGELKIYTSTKEGVA